ncbi:MAG: FG-GAP-like repeat-containing protein [Casimicrobiaceae bacterium]
MLGGTTITLVGAGTCTIRATQAGNANYAAATAVNRSFVVGKANQTIAFAALAGKTYGAAPFAIGASASSGLPVIFASTAAAVCTVSGGTVSIKSGGTCTIQASQAGNANYAAATPVSRSFAVAKAAQTINFGALIDRSYGAAPFAVNATATSGLAVSYASLTAVVCTSAGKTITIRSAGTCTIQATQAGNANFSAAAGVSRSFAVAAGAQTISFTSPGNRLIDASPVALSATASSGLTVTLSSITPAVCSVSSDMAILASPGTCTVQATQGGSGSFGAAPGVTRSFVVIAVPRFFPPAFHPAGAFPDSVVLGDFNGDGRVDAAVANAFSGNVSILSGDGAGGFAPGAAVPFGGEPIAMAAGDFNGDGKLDLAVADFYYNRVFVLTGNGNGTFNVGAPFDVGLAPIAVAAADFNRDGKLDLVVANGSIGNTTGQSVTILLGNGTGSFGAPLGYATGPSPYAVAVADFNDDGAPDMAVASGGGNSVSVLIGHGDGTFGAGADYAAGYFPDGVAAGDFNGDGKLDLAVVNDYSDDVSILLGRGDGTFGPATQFAVGSGPASVAIADLNGDGWSDLAVANRFDNTVVLLLGNGDGTFQPALAFAVGTQPEVVVAGDLDHDGLIDLVLTSAADNTVAVLLQSTGGGAMISALAGSPQVAAPGSVYASRFEALVTDSAGHPSPGVAVAFAAPAAGASGTFSGGSTAAQATSDSAGIATAPAFTANGVAGSFSVIATASGASAVFALTNAGGASQTITFAALSGKIFGAAPFNVAATATSGLSVRFASLSLPVCTVSGSVVTMVATGTCTLRASQPGDAAYVAAPDVDQSFAVAPAGQTIAFGAIPSQPAGAAPMPLSAVATSGLPVSFASLTPGVCAVTGGQALFATAGTCTIRASQPGSANYAAAANVDQSFAVTAGGQTITFAPLANQTFGGGVFKVSAAATSGLAVSFLSLTPAVCAVSLDTVALVAAGTCTIRAAQAGNASYGAAPNVDRSFAVGRAGQTITFLALSDRPITTTPLQLQATASSGLAVGLLSLTPGVCVVSADLASIVTTGTCTIRASQSGNANYQAAAVVDRSFAITRVGQIVAFANPGVHAVSTIPFALSASSSSGLSIAFTTSTAALCSINGNMATALAVGTCTIRASQAGDANYPPASADQSFLIVSALLPAPPPPPPAGPFIAYSTYLGGYGPDKAFDVAVGPDGAAYVGGSVASSNFPGLSASTFTNAGLDLLFVARVNSDGGKLDYSTVTGGRAPDISGSGRWSYVGSAKPAAPQFIGGGQVEAMAIDAAGNVYVASYANSSDYPLRGGTYVRGGPKTIYRIAPTGAVQAASMAIDPAVMTIRALAVDTTGGIYFTGVAGPGLATTPGALLAAMPAPNGSNVTATAPYLIKLAAGGSATAFATYLSVAGRRSGIPDLYDQSLVDAATTAYALAVDPSGNSYVAGQATPDQFPVTAGSPDTPDTKHRDAFVAKVDPGGTTLLFVARLGGTDAERATGIALGPDGSIVVGGKTATQPFLGTPLSFQPTVVFRSGTYYVDRETGFVAKLAADGSKWLFVAGLGTDGGNLVNGALTPFEAYPVKVAADASGAIYAAGTASPYRDVVLVSGSALPNALGGVEASGAFVVKISADGSRILQLGALGGLGVATGLALDGFGNAYLAGYGSYMTTVNAPQAAPMYEGDVSSAFIAKLNDQSAPVTLATSRNPGAAGEALTLTATVADVRNGGAVEFDDGEQVLGSVPVSGGRATLPVRLGAGVHRLRAVYRGSGRFDGTAALEAIQTIDHASAAP